MEKITQKNINFKLILIHFYTKDLNDMSVFKLLKRRYKKLKIQDWNFDKYSGAGCFRIENKDDLEYFLKKLNTCNLFNEDNFLDVFLYDNDLSDIMIHIWD